MKKRIAILLLLIYLFFPSQVQAEGKPVINEFSVSPNQWVEIYNMGSDSVDIGGWFIDDNGGTEKFTIPVGTTISPQEFKVFESKSFNLNSATPDKVQLLNGSIVIDSYSYIIGPGANNSYGRNIDGSGNWVIFNTPSKGTSNNTSIPLPTETLTPTKSPTPAHTPTPKNTPTPTKEPPPTKSPTSKTIIIQSGITSAPTPNSKALSYTAINTPTISSTATLFISAQPSSVLGESTFSATFTLTPTKNPNAKKGLIKDIQNNNTSYQGVIAIGAAVVLIACAILWWIKIKK